MNNKKNISSFLLIFLSMFYVIWQLFGLRYTNHDDIYFNIYSHVFYGRYFEFATRVAYDQARIQAFINMPIVLFADRLSTSWVYDLLNIGTFFCLYASLIWVLSIIYLGANSVTIFSVTLILFPLHYYFMFPQGYPVMAAWGLTFALISIGLVISHLNAPSNWKLIVSAVTFTLSLWGPEYNFVLHPALLGFILLWRREQGRKIPPEIIRPFALGWVVSVAAYMLFSWISRKVGGDAVGRVTFGLDILAWFKTFMVLQQKAFLPFALWNGIDLSSPISQNSPSIPTLITFSVIWREMQDWLSTIIIFSMAFGVSTMALCQQRLSGQAIRHYSVFFACIAVIPCLIVSGSSHYQLIVLKGYLQGHLVSFYNQLGLSAFTFLGMAYLCNLLPKGRLKVATITLSAVAIATLATITFGYNNINRQVMSANRQKWDAVHELAAFVNSDRPDLKEQTFYAPALWSISGVSVVPGDNPDDGENYWTKYARAALGTQLRITNGSAGLAEGGVSTTYFSIPAGSPVTILGEQSPKSLLWRLTLLSSRPVSGILAFDSNGHQVRKISNDQWDCATHCLVQINETTTLNWNSLSFAPDDHGPLGLVAQFVTSRNGSYAYPLGYSEWP